MTLTAQATAVVSAPAQEVLEFVLDLERYRQVDPKIGKIFSIDAPDEAGVGVVKLMGKVKGLPPAPDKHDILLDRWKSVRFTGAARQPGRLIFDFQGTFTCEPSGDETVITHAYEFNFKGPFRFMERRLADWLQAEIDIEVEKLAKLF